MDDRLRELERTWRESGAVEAGTSYLAALERAGEPTDELRRGLLRAHLVAAKIDVTSLVPYELIPDGPVCRLTVPGGEPALAAWRAIRALHGETGYWPLLIGGSEEELGWLEESFEVSEGSLQEILREVELAGTEAGFAIERARLEERLRKLRELDAPPIIVESLELELAAVGQPRSELEEVEDDLLGEWPLGAEPATTFTIPFGTLRRESLPRVGLLLIPAADPSHVPAWIRFGGWNECPQSVEHVKRFSVWRERYGAEVVGITHDVVEMQVARPPTTREAALELAREQFRYCNDIVIQGTQTISHLAGVLLNGTVWFFWWD